MLQVQGFATPKTRERYDKQMRLLDSQLEKLEKEKKDLLISSKSLNVLLHKHFINKNILKVGITFQINVPGF